MKEAFMRLHAFYHKADSCLAQGTIHQLALGFRFPSECVALFTRVVKSSTIRILTNNDLFRNSFGHVLSIIHHQMSLYSQTSHQKLCPAVHRELAPLEQQGILGFDPGLRDMQFCISWLHWMPFQELVAAPFLRAWDSLCYCKKVTQADDQALHLKYIFEQLTTTVSALYIRYSCSTLEKFLNATEEDYNVLGNSILSFQSIFLLQKFSNLF